MKRTKKRIKTLKKLPLRSFKKKEARRKKRTGRSYAKKKKNQKSEIENRK